MDGLLRTPSLDKTLPEDDAVSNDNKHNALANCNSNNIYSEVSTLLLWI